MVGTRRLLHLDKDRSVRRTAEEVEKYPLVLWRHLRQFSVPELNRCDVLLKDVVQEPDKQFRVVLEQVLERPVAG